MIFQTEIKGGGIQPTGTKSITSNGVHDVAAYEYADVQVPTTAPSRYLEYDVAANGNLFRSKTSTLFNFNGVKSVDAYIFYNAYYQDTNLTGTVDLSSLVSLTESSSFRAAFQQTGITAVDLSSLKVVVGQDTVRDMFNYCTGLTGILNLGKLQVFGGSQNMFVGCSGITSVDLSNLIAIKSTASGMFTNCTNLATVDISHLCRISASISAFFQNCTSLTTLSFPSLAYSTTNMNSYFQNMLQGVTGCTVHFPAEWQTTMSGWSNVTAGFGGTNTTVLFDLPNVTTLDLSFVTEMDIGNSFTGIGFNTFPNITSVDLSGLTTISAYSSCGNLFSGCTGLTSADLSNLTTISAGGNNYLFNGCTSLTSVNLSSLQEISGPQGMGYWFNGCTSLTTLSFPALKTVLNNQVFIGMLQGVTGCTVHFPSNLSSYNFNVGGSNTVLYDLPPTA